MIAPSFLPAPSTSRPASRPSRRRPHLRRQLAARTYDRILRSPTARVETLDARTAEARSSRAFLAGIDGRLYIRPTAGRRPSWFVDVARVPVAAIWVDGHRVLFRLTRATDPTLLRAVNAAYLARIGYHPAMASLLDPRAVDTTFELTPIDASAPRPVPTPGR